MDTFQSSVIEMISSFSVNIKLVLNIFIQQKLVTIFLDFSCITKKIIIILNTYLLVFYCIMKKTNVYLTCKGSLRFDLNIY